MSETDGVKHTRLTRDERFNMRMMVLAGLFLIGWGVLVLVFQEPVTGWIIFGWSCIAYGTGTLIHEVFECRRNVAYNREQVRSYESWRRSMEAVMKR